MATSVVGRAGPGRLLRLAISAEVGHTYDLISVGGNFSTSGLTVEITGLDGSAVPPGFTYSTQFADGVYSMTILSAPEPSTLLLAALGGFALLAWRRHRH